MPPRTTSQRVYRLAMTKEAQESFAPVFESEWLMGLLFRGENDMFVEASTVALHAFQLGREFGLRGEDGGTWAERTVADAVILERAARVLDRRGAGAVSGYTPLEWLTGLASSLRMDVEQAMRDAAEGMRDAAEDD